MLSMVGLVDGSFFRDFPFFVLGNVYKQQTSNHPPVTILLSTDGKPMINSKATQTSIWPVSFTNPIANLPLNIRSINRSWDFSLKFHHRSENTCPISCCSDCGIRQSHHLSIYCWQRSFIVFECSCHLESMYSSAKVSKEMRTRSFDFDSLFLLIEQRHFSVNVQLMSGDFPARAKCNRFNSHNGYYACSKCLFGGARCSAPCKRHKLYRWADFSQEQYQRRTQENINECAKRVNSSNRAVYGVQGMSPLASILSIPRQSTFDYFHLALEIHLR